MGFGSSAWRMGLGQCQNGGRLQAIGRRHLTTRTLVEPNIPSASRHGVYGSITLTGLQRDDRNWSRIPQSLLSRRHNSSNVPSRSSEKPTTTTTATGSGKSLTTSSKTPKSILSRLSGLISLKGTQTTGETGYSSVTKLVELAKPEKRQLAMAVGLVSRFQLFVRSYTE